MLNCVVSRLYNNVNEDEVFGYNDMASSQFGRQINQSLSSVIMCTACTSALFLFYSKTQSGTNILEL